MSLTPTQLQELQTIVITLQEEFPNNSDALWNAAIRIQKGDLGPVTGSGGQAAFDAAVADMKTCQEEVQTYQQRQGSPDSGFDVAVLQAIGIGASLPGGNQGEIVYISTAPSTYTATDQILIDPAGPNSVQIDEVGTTVFRTVPAASGGVEVNNLSTGAGFERVLTAADAGLQAVTTVDPTTDVGISINTGAALGINDATDVEGIIQIVNSALTVRGGLGWAVAATAGITEYAFGADISAFSLTMQEKASALTAAATLGEVWVRTATPNQLYFTDDAGTDWPISGAGAQGIIVGDIDTADPPVSEALTGLLTYTDLDGSADVGSIGFNADVEQMQYRVQSRGVNPSHRFFFNSASTPVPGVEINQSSQIIMRTFATGTPGSGNNPGGTLEFWSRFDGVGTIIGANASDDYNLFECLTEGSPFILTVERSASGDNPSDMLVVNPDGDQTVSIGPQPIGVSGGVILGYGGAGTPNFPAFRTVDVADGVAQINTDGAGDWQAVATEGGAVNISQALSDAWEFSTDLTGSAPPNNGVKWNSATPSSVSVFRIDDDGINGRSFDDIQPYLSVGSKISMFNPSDITEVYYFAVAQIPVDQTGWWSFNVEFLEGESSTRPADTTEMILQFHPEAWTDVGTSTSTNARDVPLWDDEHWEASGASFRVNPSSPPVGGRLQLGGIGSSDPTRCGIMMDIGNSTGALFYMERIAGEGFFGQAIYNASPERFVFGYEVANVETDLMAFTTALEIRIEAEAIFMLEEKTAPTTDVTNYGQLYVDSSDANLYFRDEGGTVTQLSPAASGGAQISGTPANNQIAIWTNSTTIEGDANITWDGSIFTITNEMNVGDAFNLEFASNGEDILVATVDGATDLYFNGNRRFGTDLGGVVNIWSDGNTDTENRLISFEHNNFTSRATVGFPASSTFTITNLIHSGHVLIEAEDASGFNRRFLEGDPDANTVINADADIEFRVFADTETAAFFRANAACELYYNNQLNFRTSNEAGTDINMGAEVRHNDDTFYAVGMNVMPEEDALDSGNETCSRDNLGKMLTYNTGTARNLNIDQETAVQVGAAWSLLVGPSAGTLTGVTGSGVTLRYWDGTGWTDTTGNVTIGPGQYFIWKETDILYWMSGPDIT